MSIKNIIEKFLQKIFPDEQTNVFFGNGEFVIKFKDGETVEGSSIKMHDSELTFNSINGRFRASYETIEHILYKNKGIYEKCNIDNLIVDDKIQDCSIFSGKKFFPKERFFYIIRKSDPYVIYLCNYIIVINNEIHLYVDNLQHESIPIIKFDNLDKIWSMYDIHLTREK